MTEVEILKNLMIVYGLPRRHQEYVTKLLVKYSGISSQKIYQIATGQRILKLYDQKMFTKAFDRIGDIKMNRPPEIDRPLTEIQKKNMELLEERKAKRKYYDSIPEETWAKLSDAIREIPWKWADLIPVSKVRYCKIKSQGTTEKFTLRVARNAWEYLFNGEKFPY